MRVALFGGSFDPVHQGHLVVAEVLRHVERLDRVVFVPAWRSPHKRRSVAAPEDRLAMLRLAVRGNPAFRISDVELRQSAPSYTIDTIRAWRRASGERPTLLLGGDALLDLPSWHEWQDIVAEARLVVFARPGAARARRRAAALGLHYHELVLSSVSSSSIRSLLGRQISVRYQVPDLVRRYIEAHGLYDSGRRRRA